MTTPFTPGPWRAHWCERNRRCKLGDWVFLTEPADGHSGHHVAVSRCRQDSRIPAANARLMAAAPELLAALVPLSRPE